MKTPEIYTRVFGSIPARLFTYPTAALGVWDLFTGAANSVIDFLLILLAGACTIEARKMAAYRAWKAEWDEAAGIAPKPPLRQRAPLTFGTLVYIALTILVGVLCASLPPESADALGHIYVGISGFVTLWWLWQRRKKAKAKAVGNDPVSVCPPVPTHSPNLRQVLSAMPSYARDLIERSAAMAAARYDHPV